ncbi:MAG: beta-ketoacyl synthase chain length factor [Bacteroidales bacterium]|nr:beta-ketoacyl synthase chain length factor [Bacteroidales bacterium]HOY39791.1 beta-ketoacyl synthase chain length factor [Bacteroidales bacterium]HQP04681.1 beta-ketoacyl synthase chain length factor [Bacteroidales bacterium]
MKVKNAYINGASVISIQPEFSIAMLESPATYHEPYARCIDPSFRDYFDPLAARRMSRIIKRAIITARKAVAEASIEIPDAIITGTGLGCVEETEKFLDSMIRNEEKFLQPAFFIQSTHNTISSQIALSMGCKGYNNTYIHRGVSFENALMDALLQLNATRVGNVMVTGNDEMTPNYFTLLKRIGYWKQEVPDTLKIIGDCSTPGSFAAEGSVSMIISEAPASTTYARIEAMKLDYKPQGFDSNDISVFLTENNCTPNDIDVFLTGMNGDIENDKVYKGLFSFFGEDKIAFYRNICGEYFTSSAFGILAAALCVKSGKVPASMTLKGRPVEKVRRVLFYNHFKNKDHSLILLTTWAN